MSVYTIDRPVTGATDARGIAASGAEFILAIDAVFEDERVDKIIFDVDFDGCIEDIGVTFVGQSDDLETSFVYPGNPLAPSGRHLQSDLYKLNEGFGYWNGTYPTVTKRKRDGGTYEEFVPGSRTFISAHGWNLRKIHNALRAINLTKRPFNEVVKTNFGTDVTVTATRSGFQVQ